MFFLWVRSAHTYMRARRKCEKSHNTTLNWQFRFASYWFKKRNQALWCLTYHLRSSPCPFVTHTFFIARLSSYFSLQISNRKVRSCLILEIHVYMYTSHELKQLTWYYEFEFNFNAMLGCIDLFGFEVWSLFLPAVYFLRHRWLSCFQF